MTREDLVKRSGDVAGWLLALEAELEVLADAWRGDDNAVATRMDELGDAVNEHTGPLLRELSTALLTPTEGDS